MTALLWTREDAVTWTASPAGARLIVSRLGLDAWRGEVRWRSGERASGPVMPSREAAQRWAKRQLGERRAAP